MRLELQERRVLGAIRFLDATVRTPIHSTLVVTCDGVRFVQNRSGLYVIFSAPGLATLPDAFAAQPVPPAVGSVPLTVTVTDPSGQYLARRCNISLPRDPDPANAGNPNSLFAPFEVPLLPAPVARLAPGWALIRAAVQAVGSGLPLPGALIRVTRAGQPAPLAFGLSDARGEALVAVAGVPVTTWNPAPGAVIVSDIDVTLQALYDPTAAAAVPVDPDDLEARRVALAATSSAPQNAKLAAGRTIKISFAVPVA